MSTLQHQTHRLMIFDLETAGHHAFYIRQLLRHWPTPTVLHMVVSPLFLQQHAAICQTPSCATVIWEQIRDAEFSRFQRATTIHKRALVEWQIFCHYARDTGATDGLAMFFDRFQLPLALGLPVPCRVSGILFRTTLHYQCLAGSRLTWRITLRAGREVVLWRLALHHRAMQTLFSLDPLAVPALQQMAGRARVTHLPDPIEFQPAPPQRVAALRQQLGVESGRQIALLFGFLEERKGLYPLLEALSLLPHAIQSRVCLLLIGQVAPKDVEKLARSLDELTRHTALQIILHDAFTPEAEVPIYFQMVDFVLAPYQGHIGSSGILLWAAAAGKPVLAPTYGLMGELVRRHQLGLAVDTTQPQALAQGCMTFLTNDAATGFNQAAAAQFARSHSAEQFAQALVQHLRLQEGNLCSTG